MHLNGTINCTVDHNMFDGVGGNAVWLTDFNRNANVSSNVMQHLGENGVGMTGSAVWNDGTGGNQPRFNTIEKNLIHHIGLYTKQSCAIFSAVSCQNRIAANILFHGPRAMINLNDGFGGDTLIERNLLFSAMLETGDHGLFNSWDRLPFVTRVRNGTASAVLAYNHLSRNLLLGRVETMGGRSGGGFDTDDGSDMVNATSNVLYLAALFKTDFGGHTKTYSANLDILGGACGCPIKATKYEPHGSTDRFVLNRCIGSPSSVDSSNVNCSTATTAVIEKNSYFLPNVTRSTPVCPPRFELEQGSEVLPMPTTAQTIRMAEATLQLSP